MHETLLHLEYEYIWKNIADRPAERLEPCRGPIQLNVHLVHIKFHCMQLAY